MKREGLQLSKVVDRQFADRHPAPGVQKAMEIIKPKQVKKPV